MHLSDILNLPDGVYKCTLEAFESHYFYWTVDGDELGYAGGYGGVCQPVWKVFDKTEYFQKLINAFAENNVEDYKHIFGVEEVFESIWGQMDDLLFKLLLLEKSLIYVSRPG